MSNGQIHYPNFNVMDEENEWDSHTRGIVKKRTDKQSFSSLQYLTEPEANTLFQLCAILLDDNRESIIYYVVHHFDTTLAASIGESQRKTGVPKQSDLIRNGLDLLNKACAQAYGSTFDILKEESQKEVVGNLMQENFPLQYKQLSIPVKDFIQKIQSEATAAYYSHPEIWSEIGYAGPAYPRGYVRTEFGLTDPWEAKKDAE
jgi:hypothetical protein